MFYCLDSLVQWSPIIFAINMSGLLSRRWGNGSNDPRVVSNSDEYLWRYDSNSDWYTCCSTCNAGIAFQVISMYRILWASRINSKPQSFAKCLLLCFYASATYPFGPVFAKHFQVSTQRYIYIHSLCIYIYIHELLACYMFAFWCFKSARAHLHVWDNVIWDFLTYTKTNYKRMILAFFLFLSSNFLLSDWAKALDCHFPSARDAADSFVRSPKLQRS